MSKRINLFWFKHKKGHGNFGDELGPYLLSKIAVAPVRYINIKYLYNASVWIKFKKLLSLWIRHRIGFKKLGEYCYFNFLKKPEVLLTIGSILHLSSYNNTLVWGSGIIKKDSSIPNGTYFAVRGPKTIERIKKMGYVPPHVVGDPALLLPLIYKPLVNKKYRLGIIPHFSHYEELKKAFPDSSIKIINLLDPIEKVIDDINKCSLTISTSLHGIIVSHVYGVKSLRAVYNKKPLYGDNIKFEDYYSSVKMTPGEILNVSSLFGKNHEFIEKRIKERYQARLPDKLVLKNLQDNLIEAFPYEKKPQFK